MNTLCKAPNLLLIGAPRCASTALAAALEQHPDLVVSNPKESHFLATHGATQDLNGVGAQEFLAARTLTPEDWLALFPDHDVQYRMDASVSTVSYPDRSIENIRQHCSDDVRLLVILREPVERAFSSYQYLVSRGWTDESFEQCLDREPKRLGEQWQHLWLPAHLSRYKARLAPFFDAFPGDRVHLVVAEEFAVEPQKVLQGIVDFLDIDSFEIEDVGRRNTGGRPRSRWISAMSGIVHRSPALRSMLRSLTTTEVREQLRARLLRRDSIEASTRDRLREEFAEDIDWVQSFLDRSLPGW